MQSCVLTEKDRDMITAPFCILVRHNLSLTSSTSNDILYFDEPINLTNLYAHQQYTQLDWLNIQLNDSGILGQASYIQLEQLRQKYFCSSNPLNPIRRFNHFNNNLTLMEKIAKV